MKIGNVSQMDSSFRYFVCPQCLSVGCMDLLPSDNCPHCDAFITSADIVWLIGEAEGYMLANKIQQHKRAKRMGFDDDDDSPL